MLIALPALAQPFQLVQPSCHHICVRMQMADELISNPKADLAAYEAQQAEVGRLLLEDPENEELQAIFADLADVRRVLLYCLPPWKGAWHVTFFSCFCALLLTKPTALRLQVIQLTRELAETQTDYPNKAVPEVPAAATSLDPPFAVGEQHEQLAGLAEPTVSAPAQPTGAGGVLLPPQVAEQIRHAQQRAALGGQGPAAWAVGANCKAMFGGDGKW